MKRNRTSLLPRARPKYLTKHSKARTRFDHLPPSQQGYARQGGGGLSFSNETSLGNPLYTHNPKMMEHYKRKNEQIVANDPYGHGGKYRNRGAGNRSSGMAGVMGSSVGGRMGNYGGSSNGGGGMKKGRGGVAFNL